MTVSTTRGSLMTVDSIVLTSYQIAGLLPFDATLDAGRGNFGRILLNALMNELSTEGVFQRWVDFYSVTLVDGTATYELPTYIVSLVGSGAYIAASEADVDAAEREIPVTEMSREQWQTLGSKATTGQPSLFYQHEGSGDYATTLYLWPIPDEAGTIRFQAHVQPYDSLTGSATLDLQPYWTQYILFELAHQVALAASLPMDRVSGLRSRSIETREKARGQANAGMRMQTSVDHPTPWSR